MTKLKAVIFDWAGTMIDFGSFAPMGLPKWDHIDTMLKAPRLSAEWARVHGAPPSPADVDRVYAVFVPMNEAVVADYATLVPGALQTLDWLAARGVKIGSTTGYTRSIMERVAPVAAAQGYRPLNMVCADDLPEGRPGPLGMYQCLIDLQVYPPGLVLKVDDTAPGIAEGVAAGCPTIGVALSGNIAGQTPESLAALPQSEIAAIRAEATEILTAAGASHVIDTVADLPALIAREYA